jgi:hypothetical protein
VGGDVPVIDELVGLGQRMAHVDHVEMPDMRAEDRVELGAERKPRPIEYLTGNVSPAIATTISKVGWA